MTTKSNKDRLVEALDLVHKAMNSPNAFENSKETTFSALRRGCLDVRKELDQLESDVFTDELIEDAWLFLIELSKAKLRRKHALECIDIMLTSPKWTSVLRHSHKISEKVPSISSDLQVALGFSAQISSPKIAPSTAKLPVATPVLPLQRKASIIPVPTVLRSSRSKIKRGDSKIIDRSRTVSPAPVIIQPLPEPAPVVLLTLPNVTSDGPGRRPVSERTDPIINPLNPFRQDYNPFRDSRGKKERRDCRLLKTPEWFSDTVPPLGDPWWMD
jgi:hypothetical protein